MDRIQSLVEAKNYEALVRSCEQVEFQLEPGMQWDLGEIYTALLLGYVLVDDLNLIGKSRNSARYLRKRILSTNTRTDQIDAAWRICTALWERQFPAFYQALEAFPWSDLAAPLVVDIRAAVRQRLLALVRKAYATIHKTDAAQYFGMSEDEVVSGLMNEGWEFDGDTGILSGPKTTPVKKSRTDLDQFSKLANVVLQLENH